MNITQNPPAPELRGERCQCPSCGLTFVGERAFDRHRAGEYGPPKGHPNARRCRDVPEIRSAGMQLRPDGLWRIVAASDLRSEGFSADAGANLGAPTGFRVRAVQAALRSETRAPA